MSPEILRALVLTGVIFIALSYLPVVFEWIKRRRKPLPIEPKVPGYPGPCPIKPKDTITEHGILSMGESGYPKKLTTWEKLKNGELAPAPSDPPDKTKPRRSDS